MVIFSLLCERYLTTIAGPHAVTQLVDPVAQEKNESLKKKYMELINNLRHLVEDELDRNISTEEDGKDADPNKVVWSYRTLLQRIGEIFQASGVDTGAFLGFFTSSPTIKSILAKTNLRMSIIGWDASLTKDDIWLIKDLLHEMEAMVVHEKGLDPTYTLTYDENGNPLHANEIALTWDADNRLTRYDNGANPVDFIYDWAGSRVKKTSTEGTYLYLGDMFEVRKGSIIKHIYAGSQRIASIGTVVWTPPEFPGCERPECSIGKGSSPTWQDLLNWFPIILVLIGIQLVRGRIDPHGFLRKRPWYKLRILLFSLIFIWSAWPPMPAKAQEPLQAVVYYHTDHLGSSSVLTDHNGSIVQRLSYTPFGDIRLNNDITWDSPYKFTGTELDLETGFYHMGARYYWPKLGRFISPDPIVPDPANSQALNRYSYVLNNPLRYTDPSGYSWLSDVDNWFQKNVFDPIAGAVARTGEWFQQNVITPMTNWFQTNVINPVVQAAQDIANELKVSGWFDVGNIWDWLSLVGLIAVITIAVILAFTLPGGWPILAFTLMGIGYGLMVPGAFGERSMIQKAFFGAAIGFGIGLVFYYVVPLILQGFGVSPPLATAASKAAAITFAGSSALIFLGYVAGKAGVKLPPWVSLAATSGFATLPQVYEYTVVAGGPWDSIEEARGRRGDEEVFPGSLRIRSVLSTALRVSGVTP